jgi:hypothetical protein
MRFKMRQLGSALGVVAALVLCVQSAHADLTIQFKEAAPKDRVVVKNRTACKIAAGSITFDLRSSASGLFFDTAPSGPGENVAQPFEIARTESVSASFPNVPDGASIAEFQFRNFLPGGEIEVTVDADDSIRSGPRGVQMIDASEMVGERVTVATSSGVLHAATFDNQGQARIELTECLSN